MVFKHSQLALMFLCLVTVSVAAQQSPAALQNTPQPGSADAAQPAVASESLNIFPHPDSAPYLISGQANIIFQAHPGFHSPYEGTNSLLARGEYKTSLVGTIYTAFALHLNHRYETEALYDLESAGGRGVSEALGLAGFTNLDVVRNPQLGPKPYTARVQLHQTFGLTDKMVDAERTQFSLATKVPERRFELRAGKMTLPDFFDANGPGSDSHLQFLNWTVDNNGAWDYAAETRGYTYSFFAEYDDANWSARYSLSLMPTKPNGTNLEWNLRRARGENYEFEYRQTPFALLPERLLDAKRKGAVRLLGFVNQANMGLYRNANEEALAERAAGYGNITPNIDTHTFAVKVKYGVGLNFEQEVADGLRVFGRFGWNEGQHESYCYTEVDQTFELGGDLAGNRWGRPHDRVGLAGVSNAIKHDHQEYLALGGLGFLLGDGRLDYAREDILETYYTAHNWRGLFTSFDTQLIAHPGYNQDRGPVEMFSVRTHVDF